MGNKIVYLSFLLLGALYTWRIGMCLSPELRRLVTYPFCVGLALFTIILICLAIVEKVNKKRR